MHSQWPLLHDIDSMTNLLHVGNDCFIGTSTAYKIVEEGKYVQRCLANTNGRAQSVRALASALCGRACA